MQRNCISKGLLQFLFLKHEITQYFNNDIGLIKIIYGVTKKKQDYVFGGVHLVAVSISNVGTALWTPCRNKAGLACKGLPIFSKTIFHLKYGILKIHLFGLGRWVQGKGRNTGCLSKKNKYLAIRFIPQGFLQVSSSSAPLSDRMLNSQGRGFCIHPGHIQNNVSTALHQTLLHKAFQLPECTQLTLRYIHYVFN